MDMLTVVLGDKAAKVALTDAPIIEAFKADAAKAFSDMETSYKAALEAKDEEIGTLKADKKKLEDAAMTPERQTQLVADRVALESAVKAIDEDIKTANVSDADLRKAAVASKYGDEMVKDSSDAEITGMFKALAKDAATKDPFVETLKDGVTHTTNQSDAWGAFLPKEA